MKSSQSVKQLGEDLDAFTWNSPAVSSPTARRKKTTHGTTMRRDASAPVLSSTTGDFGTTGSTRGRIQQNNFMTGHTSSTSSFQRPLNAARVSSGSQSTSMLYGQKSVASKSDDSSVSTLSLPPKVFVPHDTRPGWTPRAVVVRRLQQSYSTTSLSDLLEESPTIDMLALYEELLKNTEGTEGTEDPFSSKEENSAAAAAAAAAVTSESASAGTTKFKFGSKLGTNLMKMLPITMFDDSEFEIHSLDTWVSHRAPGRAIRGQEWSPCIIVGLDKDNERLMIEWTDDHSKAIIHRLGICFDSEDPVSHVHRLEHCMRSRKLAESCIRYNLYIDCMPAEELGGLAAEQVNRVLSRAMSTNAMKENEYDTSTLLNEIDVDYSRTMNKIIFDANMSVPENKHIAETLTLPPAKIDNQIVPEKGVVPVTQYDLEERFKSFVFGTFLVQPEVVYVLERVQQQCNKILDMRLFNTCVDFVVVVCCYFFFIYFFFARP